MALPLHERAQTAGHTGLADIVRLSDGLFTDILKSDPALMPDRPLAPGEQYRFHFDMTRCIGCRSCEVACNEQNGNPEEIRWRRIGEIEGGSYPDTQRLYLSMGCNHCIEPDCLKGCPVAAYTKDSATGVVLHSTDMCIGCQYCTWNCSFGVPQYNPDRGVVGKCDMCYNRLTDGMEPACVNACPENAIQIEIVNTAAWVADHHAAASPGMPVGAQAISTTRITLPENPTAFLANANANRVVPEHPHWPLVFMTVLMQSVMGALCFIAPSRQPQPVLMTLLFLIVNVALALSTFHLGRPAFAWRALKMWKQSWLSREVLLFSLFTGALSAAVAVHWMLALDLLPTFVQQYLPRVPVALAAKLPALMMLLDWTALALALLGTVASSFIYLIKARPAWNTVHTPIDYIATGLLGGSVLYRVVGVYLPHQPEFLPLAGIVTQITAALWIGNYALRLLRMAQSPVFEQRATVKLLGGALRREVIVAAIAVLAGVLLSIAGMVPGACAVLLFGALVLRYLFFVSVVPLNMALTFLNQESAH